MCLILLANNIHPHYKLVVAANRDEFYQRRTKQADFWDDHPAIVAGRDLEAGGTWMGMNKMGKISMVTNYRDLSNYKPNAPSRGQLVADFLKNHEPASKYLQQISERGNQYNGFNIICGTADSLYYYGNYGSSMEKITPGYHGLSNALLNTEWPKITKGLGKLKAVLKDDRPDPYEILQTLYDDIKAPRESLPDTGVGMELEHMLSSMFIKSGDYGSRCSTVVLIDYKNKVQYLERTYDVNEFTYSDKNYEFVTES